MIPFSLKGLLGEKIIVILLEYSFRNCIVKICLYFKYLLGLKTELLTGLQNAKFTETQIVYAHVWLCSFVNQYISVSNYSLNVLVGFLFFTPAYEFSVKTNFSNLHRYN